MIFSEPNLQGFCGIFARQTVRRNAINNLQYENSSSRRLFVEGSKSKYQEKNVMSTHKGIQPVIMEENFLNNFKLYVHIYQGLLREESSNLTLSLKIYS